MALKEPDPDTQKGLTRLPEDVRNKMGYMKKGGKVKKFNDGGMSLEEKYPGAKITRAGPQPPPVEGGKGSEQHIRNLEALRYMRENLNAKPELFEEPKSKGRSGGGGGGGGIPKVGPKRPMEMKAGGTVSKADMQKAGFYDKGKTTAERQNIVKKVTTKPQRVAIVEKAFSTKNMKSGGMASKRADGCAVRGKTRA